MYLENQESVREKSGKSQGIFFVKVCGNPAYSKHSIIMINQLHYTIIHMECFFRIIVLTSVEVSYSRFDVNYRMIYKETRGTHGKLTKPTNKTDTIYPR